MTFTAEPAVSTSLQVDQCQRLARVLTMTQRMLAHADAQEWEQVIELERERRDDLSLCFSQAATIADTALIAEALTALLTLNEELMAKLKTAKSEAMQMSISYSRNRSAVDSYSSMQVTS